MVFIFIVNTSSYFAHLLTRRNRLTMVNLTGYVNSYILYQKGYITSTFTSYMFIFFQHVWHSCCTFYNICTNVFIADTILFRESCNFIFILFISISTCTQLPETLAFIRVRTTNLKRCANPYKFCEKSMLEVICESFIRSCMQL